MTTLIIGTTNLGKVRQMSGALADTGLRCVPISDLLADLPDVAEVGNHAAAIAERKAVAYSAAVGDPVLSLDHWLTFDEVSGERQPRGHVRRIPGRPDGANDDELVDYYVGLCREHGGRLTARWELGVAVAGRAGVRSATAETVRTLVDKPCATRVPGLPLSCLQIDAVTGKYVSEHTDLEEQRLWQRVYGKAIASFVIAALSEVAT